MKVVTVANKWPTEPYYLHREFLASLKRFGHEPLILGTKPGEYKGLGSKPRLLKAAIDSGQITDERIIFADAFDVIFACAPELINEHALGFYGPEILWNSEKSCFPDGALADKHPLSPTSFRYLNSGFGIGRTADFLAVLEWMKADEIPDDSRNPDGSGNHPNDQDFWMRALLFSGLPMNLDTNAICCQTLCGVTEVELDFTGEIIANRETGSFPCSFHANGPSKTSGVVEPILRKLGLR